MYAIRSYYAEKCNSMELVYTTKVNKFYGQVTGYVSEYSNLIHRKVDTINPNVNAVYVNEGNFMSYGVEAELRYQNLKIMNAFASYNYCIGDDKGIGANFKYVPMHTIAFGLNKPIHSFYVSTNAYAYSNTEGHIDCIPYQYTIDAALGYKHRSLKGVMLNHSFSVKNISYNFV